MPPIGFRGPAPKKCNLAAISDPRLNGLTVGLNFAEEGPTLCPKTYSCCAGLGWQDTPSGVQVCELRARFRRVENLVRAYEAMWGAVLPFSDYLQWLAAWDFEIIKNVSHMLKGYAPQCRLIENSPLCIKGKPSACWAMALVAVWRFGKEAEVVPFHEIKPSSLHELIIDSAAPGFVLVEKIGELYKEEKALWLEYLINQAYNSNVFLVLEILPPKAPNQLEGGAAREFRRRLAETEPKSFREHLDADGQSKLGEMQRLPNPKFRTAVDPLLDS